MTFSVIFSPLDWWRSVWQHHWHVHSVLVPYLTFTKYRHALHAAPAVPCVHSDSGKDSVPVLYKCLKWIFLSLDCDFWHFKMWPECPYQGVIMPDFFNKHSAVLRWYLIITCLPNALISLDWLLYGQSATRCHCSRWISPLCLPLQLNFL